MAYAVEWADSAINSLLEAVEYIAKDSPSYAATLAVKAEAAAKSLEQFAHRGRRVSEYRDPNIRELIVGRTYRLIYHVSDDVVTVIAFVHTARDLQRLIASSDE